VVLELGFAAGPPSPENPALPLPRTWKWFRAHVDASHHMVDAFDKVHIAFGIEAHFVWFVELRRCRRATVAGISGLASSGDRANRTTAIDRADRVIRRIAKVERSVGSAHKSGWSIETRVCGGAAIS